ncbi:MAG TPA: glycosyltransferase, partial [Chitinophagales bacterium]|nr:glycosyltransferase [Chitinophagales bacterium]
MAQSKTLIFIPTYNEAENAPRLFQQIQMLHPDADFLFLDDNSPDGTGKILDAIAEEHRQVNVIHRKEKSGIGSAHKAGIQWAYD